MGFCATLLIYPVTFMVDRRRDEVDTGGKIILPPTVLDFMANQTLQYPMLFKLSNIENNVSTHCGVLEFIAEEGTFFAPTWMLEQLKVEAGSFIKVESATLPVATFSRFQPQQTNFLDISNPKAVLENQLRKYACLTVGDVIALSYNDKIYRLKVEEARPRDAVKIIECDMEVDFSAPEGYVDPKIEQQKQELEKNQSNTATVVHNSNRFRPFSGKGHRLDGKENKVTANEDAESDVPPVGIPDYDYKIGSIEFFRNERPVPTNTKEDAAQSFPGNGRSL
uniref:Uncharacterized protein n=3 Tax=Rhodnius prolixus TaxID=13249 RepID=T1HZX7_RHOPR